MNSQSFTARCHCGTFSSSFAIPKSSIPLKSSICHCNDCRHASGQLFATFASMPTAVPPPDTSKLTAYRSSSILTRYFCPKCGAAVCIVGSTEWKLATGILDSTEHLLNRVHAFVNSSGDAVAASWFKHVGHNAPGEATREHVAHLRTNAQGKSHIKEEHLTASCKCGQLRFGIAQPTAQRSKSSTYPANLCACSSCRRTSGFELSSWATVPKGALRILSSSTMIWYESSGDVRRSFCDRCGATAFWRSEKKDPGNYDIATGLFEAKSGAAAEDWFEWEAEVHHASEATDPELVGDLVKGSKEYHQRREMR